MSVAAKQALINKMTGRLGSTLTVDEMAAVRDALASELEVFSIEMMTTSSAADSLDYLRAFLDAKRVEGRSERTIEHYRYVLERMSESVRMPTPDITVYSLRAYLAAEKARGLGDKTLEGIRTVLCSYFGWLHREGLIKVNPAANLNAIKCQKKIRLPFSNVEIEKIKESCKSNRDKAIVALLASTGCRISEVCRLNRDDIKLDSRECRVLGKGNKERNIYYDDVTEMLLARYLAERTDNEAALFVGKSSTRLTPGGIRNMLKTLEARSGVVNVHPHRFRRTLATGLINRGMPIQEVATILGHDKLDTTMVYVHVTDSKVKSSYERYF